MILLLSTLCVLALPAHARTLTARIARVDAPVATLQGVTVRLDWPAQATQGRLVLQARQVDAPDLGYRYRDVSWECPLRRDGKGGWICAGALRSARGGGFQLALDLGVASTDAQLSRGNATLSLHRNAAAPDLTTIDLTRVPVVWAQALSAQAWKAGRFKSGTLDGRLQISTPTQRPMRISGPLAVTALSLDTPDAAIAAENIGGTFEIDYRKTPQLGLLTLDGRLRGGEFLAGNTYIALPKHEVRLLIEGMQRAGEGLQLPRIAWNDGDALQVEGNARFTTDATLHQLDLTTHSRDMSPLRERYLSGWLGVFGLGDVDLHGASDVHVRVEQGKLVAADARLHGVDLVDPKDRFGFTGLQGDVRFSGGTTVDSELRWRSSRIYGLDFGASSMPFRSRNGVLEFRQSVRIPTMGGSLTFENMTLRPPVDDTGMDIRFALQLDDIDFGQVSKALGLPAFKGVLNGHIPSAHYYGERLDFDGGLSMAMFDGTVQFSSLSMERPFGVAPSLTADIDFNDLDLLRLTEVLDFGSITGRLDGHVHHLRLVDWTPVAFDAQLFTDNKRGVKQRISQRAVQNISSVGDQSFTTTLQGKLIGLFDDFGYARIGISCRLVNEVCDMGGLRSAGNSFTIVEGAGLPRLTVVGFNRQVDWPTLVERLAAVGKGDVKPVID